MGKKKDFIGINHGKHHIDLTHFRNKVVRLKPIEIHLKEDGALGDKPSVAIVMNDGHSNVAIGELSLKMWNEGLADIGYEIRKKE